MNNLQEEDRTGKMGLEAYAKQVGFVEQVFKCKKKLVCSVLLEKMVTPLDNNSNNNNRKIQHRLCVSSSPSRSSFRIPADDDDDDAEQL